MIARSLPVQNILGLPPRRCVTSDQKY